MSSILLMLAGCQPKASEKDAQSEKKLATEKAFQKVDPYDFATHSFSLFHEDWFLLTAGKDTSFNPMTISWGALGTLWQQPVATVYVRPTRHTYQLMESGRYFTLCAFGEEYRDMLSFMGSKSGRDMDKVKEAGLTPLKTELGNQYYQEATLVIECEKIYSQDLDYSRMTDSTALATYKNGENVHRMYVGKVVNIWQKK